jgi:hypothetical protein
VTKAQIAKEVSVSRADLESLTFGLDVTDGSAKEAAVPRRSHASLTVVK